MPIRSMEYSDAIPPIGRFASLIRLRRNDSPSPVIPTERSESRDRVARLPTWYRCDVSLRRDSSLARRSDAGRHAPRSLVVRLAKLMIKMTESTTTNLDKSMRALRLHLGEPDQIIGLQQMPQLSDDLILGAMGSEDVARAAAFDLFKGDMTPGALLLTETIAAQQQAA